ncbi:TonB-dependent Receptor Plug Domain [Altererythrobacter xiamenensis]|uniref:TonB-dependent Receptor Plug Domain n=1 Tax=Altererythrobacter xiamenensis TaxID=1316679 RepID=A0A1Y6F8J1_9SPHN|nr:TonB-dependent receptor [Altererythrobacter xiamenensis]SMQ69700.1 TonB-dependent Receptor Plug Domain [Altererythrobacter xiamenensis]
MKKPELYLGAAAVALFASPVMAQDAGDDADTVIIVTAQRQAQSLQEVPIAVSAFDSEALESQQIENASDLQLTLPNVSFTKSNFTASSFTIRGIGDLCVGVSCDSATAIHVNSAPLFGTRLFETEYFDLERIEVLRGPQGTLFGRNATSGVVNVVTAKPDLSGFGASAEFEYGNYNSIKAKGMVNLPIGDSIGARVAGFYLKRDGFTENLTTGEDFDDRDMFAVRGSLRFEPGPDTTIDLMAYYFEEDDNRSRIQKQLCQRDPTGVLGCLNARRDFDKLNANSTFTGTLGSSEFLAVNGIPSTFGLNSLYGPDAYFNFDEPNDVRKIRTEFVPEYYTDELQLQAHIEHNFGPIQLGVTGTYQDTTVDSRQDYNQGVGEIPNAALAFGTLNTFANPLAVGPVIASYFQPVTEALFDGAGNLCTSDTRLDNRGSYEGFRVCTPNGTQFDRSNQDQESFSVEAIVSSDFDGPFNFLLGGIYAESEVAENSYYVNAFAIDYIAGVLGSFTSLGGGLDPSYLATSFYRNNTTDFKLKSFGIFGEVYYDITDRLKFTGGLRYNDDKKSIAARTTLAAFLNPYSNDGDPFDSPYVGSFDADSGVAGNQLLQEREVGFDEITGRAVLDYSISPDNHVYASYSRGYKSGGINPPLSPVFSVPESFGPESIDAFEIGSKNTFANGALQLNATAFYYKYKGLQLSRIIARTSVNDSIDANIWGIELESIIRPSYNWLINMNFSYLNAEVAGDQFFSNPRDPGAGDPDAVIIKDITNGALCAVTGPAPGAADAFVNGFNAGLNAATGSTLQGTNEFPGDGNIASSGAFSICGSGTGNPLQPGEVSLTSAAPPGFTVLSPGIQVNLKGNKLPQAPTMKASVGAQYTHEFSSGMTLVPRMDIAFTGEQYGNVFNGNVNRLESFVQANAQIQLNAANERWFIRGFVQNIFDSDSVTGLYVTDASSGLFSNIFTLDPRRYGVAVGVSF